MPLPFPQSRPFLRKLICLLALAGSSAAHAVPYAYAEIEFSAFALYGLDAAGVSVSGATVTTSSASVYPGGAADGAAVGGNLLSGSDVRQSTSGLQPGQTVAENFFRMALMHNPGARSDAIISGNLITGDPAGAASVLAEGQLSPFGSAASAAGTSTGFTLNLVLTSPTTFTLSFLASTIIAAMTSEQGEGASAQTNASFTVTGDNGYFDIFAPDELNASTSSTNGNGDGIYTNGPTTYFKRLELAAGSYQFSLLAGAQQRLERSSSSDAADVPEPAPLMLIGAGLAGVMLLGSRRKKTGKITASVTETFSS